MADVASGVAIEEGLDGDEVLFRSVRPDDVKIEGAEWHLSVTAFNDRNRQPSVDRAAIRPDPSDSRKEGSHGIVEFLTGEVRTEVHVVMNPGAPAKQQQEYKVDVFARPIPEDNPEHLPANPAHAQIETAPTFRSNEHFNKLKDKLCRLAERRGFRIIPVGVTIAAP